MYSYGILVWIPTMLKIIVSHVYFDLDYIILLIRYVLYAIGLNIEFHNYGSETDLHNWVIVSLSEALRYIICPVKGFLPD